MNNDSERRLRQVSPLGAPAELRPRVLAAVAEPLESAAPPAARRPFRPALTVAAGLLASLALNVWVNDRGDRRLAVVLGPPAVRKQAAEIAADVASITDSATGRWVYGRLAANRPEYDVARPYAVRLQQLIQQLTLDFKETADEALGKILKWTAIVAAAAITILLTLNAYFVWSTGTELERRLTALRQAGDPVQLADLAHEPIPPEKNADVFFRRAADDLDAIQKELLALYPKKESWTGALSATEQDTLEKLFAAYPRVMPLLEQAADCPDTDPQLDASPPTTRFLDAYIDRTTKHRLINRVLRTRCAFLLSKGRTDDALANQILVLRLTRHWRDEPLILACLVTAVCEIGAMEGVNQVLQSGTVSPSARQALDAELARHDTMEGYNGALRSERAYSLSSAREIPGSGFWLTRGFSNELALGLIDFYDRCLANSSRLYCDVVANKATPSTRRYGPNLYGALITLLGPAMAATREATERTRAMCRSVRVLNALQARVPPGSNLVPKLTDLGLPEATTIDPFNGEPLRINKLPEGWTVYSVGGNLTDDGGKVDGKKDVGVGPTARVEMPKRN